MIVIDQRVRFPELGPGRGIERDQAPVIGGFEDLALVECEATADSVAAPAIGLRPVNTRIERPDFCPGPRVNGMDHIPGGRLIHDAVDDEGRCLDAAR
ncbi:hypothetical protein ACVWXN_006164 [Bradyrhizobium sp. i1.4.4]